MWCLVERSAHNMTWVAQAPGKAAHLLPCLPAAHDCPLCPRNLVTLVIQFTLAVSENSRSFSFSLSRIPLLCISRFKLKSLFGLLSYFLITLLILFITLVHHFLPSFDYSSLWVYAKTIALLLGKKHLHRYEIVCNIGLPMGICILDIRIRTFVLVTGASCGSN